MAAKTIEAYERDLRQFLMFLADYRGGEVTVDVLAGLGVRDFRSFLAKRRRDEVSGRS